MADASKLPACERCRTRRNKCDRGQPTCSRCRRASVKCEYKSRNTSSIFMRYTSDLEAEIARLETELVVPQSAERSKPSPIGDFTTFDREQSDAEITIDDLLGQQEPFGDDSVGLLLEGFSQVSLSATTRIDEPLHKSHNVLLTIILSSAIPGILLHGFGAFPGTVGLPPREIAGKVVQRYVKEVLPELPFISPQQLSAHFRMAYGDNEKSEDGGLLEYSIFLISCVIASTSVHVSPKSLPGAINLFVSGLRHFIGAVELGYCLKNSFLCDLEAVVAMSQFAEAAQLALESWNRDSLDDLFPIPDFWQLSGIAVRISVDCGLHKMAKTARARALLQATLTLDSKASAINRGWPLGIARAAVYPT